MKEAVSFTNALGMVSLGVVSWIGFQTWDNGKQLAAHRAMEEANFAVVAELKQDIAQLNQRLHNTIGRGEFDARIVTIETRLREMDVEIARIKLDAARVTKSN